MEFFRVYVFSLFNHYCNADPNISPVSNPPVSNDGTPIKSPTNETHKSAPPVNHARKNGSDDTFAGSSPAVSPPAPTAKRLPSNSLVPSLAPSNEAHNSPALSPSASFHEHQHKRNERTSPAPASSDLISPPPLKQQGVISYAPDMSLSY